MTDFRDLSLVWASTGGETDPGSTKYATGWVAEIPTFQNFNYVLGNATRNALAFAEIGAHEWSILIGYKVGAKVIKGGKAFFCRTFHAAGSPQDPEADTDNSHWSVGHVLSSVATPAYVADEGYKLDRIVESSTTLWKGSDITISNTQPAIMLATLAGTDNLVLANIAGKLKVMSTGTALVPDSRANAFNELYHEGHKPTQSEVAGTVPLEVSDGKMYARKDANWVEVTTTVVSAGPPPATTGDGTGWYNLDEGRLYIDINDGDSSQWAPAAPPTVPSTVATAVSYSATAQLNAANVQAALTLLAPKSWQNAALINSWTSLSTARYRLESGDNVLRLEGRIANGTTASSTTIFTLPTGYRPTNSQSVSTMSSSYDNVNVDISPSGAVVINGGNISNSWLNLSGITISLT